MSIVYVIPHPPPNIYRRFSNDRRYFIWKGEHIFDRKQDYKIVGRNM